MEKKIAAHSCLRNPMNREVWPAIIHRVEKESDTTEQLNKNKSSQLSQLLYCCDGIILLNNGSKEQEK